MIKNTMYKTKCWYFCCTIDHKLLSKIWGGGLEEARFVVCA